MALLHAEIKQTFGVYTKQTELLNLNHILRQERYVGI